MRTFSLLKLWCGHLWKNLYKPNPDNVRVLNQSSTFSTVAIRNQSEMWIVKWARNAFHCDHEIFLEHNKNQNPHSKLKALAVYPFCQQKRLFYISHSSFNTFECCLRNLLTNRFESFCDISAAACERRRKQTADVRTSCWCSCHIKFVINFIPIAHYRCFIWCVDFLHQGYHDDVLFGVI